MSRVLVIGSDSQVSREISSSLSAAGFPIWSTRRGTPTPSTGCACDRNAIQQE